MRDTPLDALRRAQDRDLARRDDVAIVRARRLRSKPPRPRALGGLAAAALVAVGVFVLARETPAVPPPAYVSRHDLPLGAWWVAPEGGEAVSFADGSHVDVAEGSRARVEGVTEHGATLSIDPGGASVAVVHHDDTAWRLILGPYVVRVTGTRFDVSWRDHVLSVVMEEGAVVIEGPGLEGPHAVVAGQRFEITDPAFAISPPATAEAPPEAPPRERSPRPRVASTTTAPVPPGYRTAAESGDYEAVAASPEVAAIDPAHDEITPGDLLLLGDAARYAHDTARARAFYEALRNRHSESDEARTATYALGLLAFDAGDASEAATWMRIYTIEAPDGPLASEARGRLLEALVLGRDPAARDAAADYLSRAPHGPHAGLARHVMIESE